VAGPDGNLWFTEFHGNKIGRITTDGVIMESIAKPGIGTYGITAGPDGNIWFTESNGNAIAEFRFL
jgi:streptogramin lyase